MPATTGLGAVLLLASGLAAGEIVRLAARRRRAEARALRRVRRTGLEVQMILDNLGSGLITVDANGKVTRINPLARRILGLGEHLPRGEDLELVLGHGGDNLARLVLDALLEGKPRRRAEVTVKRGETSVPLGVNVVFLTGEDGALEGAITVFTDLTEVRRLQEHLRRSDRLAGVGELAASIAHEIRNPLAALNHASQLLEESPQIRLAEMRLINIIQNHAKRMNGIVENILQLSRREQSQPEVVPLHVFLPEFAMEFETSKINHSLEFTTDFDGEEAWVLYDKGQLHQCLWKLLDNAVDHASRDKPNPAVRLALARDPEAGFCVITVADNGPGITKAQLSKIFEPFYTTRKEGSGLGLYIARQLCEANQAELTVDSEPGEGAYFHIRLALARAGQGQDAARRTTR